MYQLFGGVLKPTTGALVHTCTPMHIMWTHTCIYMYFICLCTWMYQYVYTYICIGLEVLVGDKSYWFDYCWGSFNKSSVRPFPKKPLTLHESTFPHFRLHKLTRDDSLKFFMSMMASIPATLVVILVNIDNTYQLSEKFVSEEGEIPSVPVILVTNETGCELMNLLETSPRDVKAEIHSKSQEPPCESNLYKYFVLVSNFIKCVIKF